MRYIMFSTGNIPVDRKSKDRQSLFKGTINALSDGSAVALFPEGTSYTEPRIMQVKDGAAWAALEFTRWLKQNPGTTQQDVTIVPVSIVYTNKTKYRSEVRFYYIIFTKKLITILGYYRVWLASTIYLFIFAHTPWKDLDIQSPWTPTNSNFSLPSMARPALLSSG